MPQSNRIGPTTTAVIIEENIHVKDKIANSVIEIVRAVKPTTGFKGIITIDRTAKQNREIKAVLVHLKNLTNR